MNVIVIGCGKVGSRFAELLAGEGHDVVIVDNDRNNFKLLSPEFNGITVTGVPIDQDVLKQAGIENADALAAVTPDDNINIMACQVAKEVFKVSKVIARIYNPAREHVFHQFGLDTICPTNITVDVIHAMILGTEGVNTYTIGETVVDFKYEKIVKGMEGKNLSTVKASNGSLLFGIKRKGELILANPHLVLEKDDLLVIAQKPE